MSNVIIGLLKKKINPFRQDYFFKLNNLGLNHDKKGGQRNEVERKFGISTKCTNDRFMNDLFR